MEKRCACYLHMTIALDCSGWLIHVSEALNIRKQFTANRGTTFVSFILKTKVTVCVLINEEDPLYISHAHDMIMY